MKRIFSLILLLTLTALSARAKSALSGPPPSTAPVLNEQQRQADYTRRIDEVIDFAAAGAKFKTNDPAKLDLVTIAAKLVRGQDYERCSQRVIELMSKPGTGPFWMFPTVSAAYLGRGRLTPAALASIREAWRTTRQLRGDTENHWMMYYASLYLMSELYPNDPAESWYTGKSSAENLAEARAYLIHWTDLSTSMGQGEFNPTEYIGEYAIPLLFLASWAKDPAIKERAHLMLDWLFAELAANTLNRSPSGGTRWLLILVGCYLVTRRRLQGMVAGPFISRRWQKIIMYPRLFIVSRPIGKRTTCSGIGRARAGVGATAMNFRRWSIKLIICGPITPLAPRAAG